MKIEPGLNRANREWNLPQNGNCASLAHSFPVLTSVVLAVALSALLVSCSGKSDDAKAQSRTAAPVPVLVAKATTRDVPVEILAIGTVQSFSLVSVRPQVPGKIVEIHFQEGQEVKEGDLLVTLDPRQWIAALNQARANLIRDEAQMTSARLAFLRTSNLFVSKIASQQDFDIAEAEFRALEATALADAAAVSNAQVNLGYTEIRSPIDGRTGNLTTKAGNVVKAVDDVLVTVTMMRPVYVAFSVPEQHLGSIRRRFAEATLPVQAFAPGERHNPAWGDLTFIDNTVDMSTGTILLKGSFPNTNSVLWPGQFVQTVLTLSNLVQAVVVPSQAVATGQNGEYIFVVNADQTVTPRSVETGITYDGIRVIQSGIQAGETVVTDGQLRLVPGAKVSITTPEAVGLSTNTGAK